MLIRVADDVFHTCKWKNKNKNKQKTIRPIRMAYDYFLHVRKVMRLIRSHRDVCTKIPAFYRRLWLAAPLFRSYYFADIQGEKIFSQISSLRKLRSISKIGVDSFVYFTVDEQRSYFVFCLNRAFYWNSFISCNCTFRTKS